ncbi:MAG: serine hydrolase domain-containing protein, partial [bacterium]
DLESVGYSGGLIIAKDSKIILAKGYGYADREHQKIFDRKTIFTIGSITKQFTGAAVVTLESMGKISFHDSITDYFSQVPADKKSITIHQLLTHTAGFPGAIGDDYEKISRDDFIRQALSTELKFTPGTRYSYSNVGYSLLGAIIEIVTGKSYEYFLRKNLFLPAGMKHTGYVLPEWNEKNIVIGYRGDKKWGKPTDHLWGENGPGWHLKCNGGILSTLDDMYKWGKAILSDSVLSRAVKKNYLTPYVAESPDSLSYYAYGWVRMKSRRGTDVITHNGGNPYIQNDMYIYPDDKVIMFITSNNGHFSAIDQSEKILEMIF